MAQSDDVPVRLPSTVAEWLRVAHALRFGGPRKAAHAWAVVSTGSPLLRIQGITGDEPSARKLLATPPDREWGWSEEEIRRRELWGPIPLGAIDDAALLIDPFPHTAWTETCSADALLAAAAPAPASLASAVPTGGGSLQGRHLGEVRFRLIAEDLRGNRLAALQLPLETDAVFLTRGAREAFLYPEYEAFFGRGWTAALRKRLGES